MNWAKEKKNIGPVVRTGLVYGALTGSVIAAFGGFTLNNISTKFRALPVGVKVFLGSSCIVAAAIREQDKRVKQYIFLKHWDQQLNIEGMSTAALESTHSKNM
ncbi:hypothetical protein V1512DRAFT_267198 [Lipomyces arxii]|uniref:uncharacterized protein n=1 Tax=Lipomyces arxii TaxID=56418 RepID=UPI0034CEB88B